jgi:hypothetical protein
VIGIAIDQDSARITAYSETDSPLVTVLGIAMEDKRSDVVSYVAKPQFDVDGQQVAMNYPVMLGSDEVAAKFGGFLGYPDSFVISKDSEVVEKVMGAIDADSASQLIRRLLRREGERGDLIATPFIHHQADV